MAVLLQLPRAWCCVSARVLRSTCLYYSDLGRGLLDEDPSKLTASSVHVFSLVLTLRLWNTPHYRAPTFAADIRKNLSNVAVPGTGVPLSVFCVHWVAALTFLLLVNPGLCLAAALYLHLTARSPFSATYDQLLRNPIHWFAIWRLNCVVVAYHSLLTKSQTYGLEDKGTFLIEAPKHDIAVSPLLHLDSIVAKHKNIEGGMAIHFFRNFLDGGDWILQPALKNSAFLASLLPRTAPLSTLRIITASYRGLQQLGGPVSASEAASMVVVTVVFRAGLAGAPTDHTSICFDVCRDTGTIHAGVSNQHWYKLGLGAMLRVHGSISATYTHHPDSGVQIHGQQIPDFGKIRDLVCRAHEALVPDVPLVGWDVALTDEGPCLLEMNISCNFFNGSYDREWYSQFVKRYLVAACKRHKQLAADGRKRR